MQMASMAMASIQMTNEQIAEASNTFTTIARIQHMTLYAVLYELHIRRRDGHGHAHHPPPLVDTHMHTHNALQRYNLSLEAFNFYATPTHHPDDRLARPVGAKAR